MKKVKVATVWLDGCSGCHMSLLDMDATIISLARKIDIVLAASPLQSLDGRSYCSKTVRKK